MRALARWDVLLPELRDGPRWRVFDFDLKDSFIVLDEFLFPRALQDRCVWSAWMSLGKNSHGACSAGVSRPPTRIGNQRDYRTAFARQTQRRPRGLGHVDSACMLGGSLYTLARTTPLKPPIKCGDGVLACTSLLFCTHHNVSNALPTLFAIQQTAVTDSLDPGAWLMSIYGTSR